MLTFEYTARDAATGKKVTADVQAESEQAAAHLIHKEGLAPLSIKQKGEASQGLGKYLHRIKTKDKVIFSRQLSTMINAGLPLLQAIRQVSEQTQNKTFRGVINKIITDIEGGSALSIALAQYPGVFNSLFVNLVAAGEASGTLDKALERIANQQEKDAEIISKVRGALAYPGVVLFVMVGVVGFMIVKVLPQVETIYKGLPGTRLPIVTVILLSISHFTVKYWWVVILGLGFLTFATSRWARTFGGKQVIDKLKMKLWPTGPLFMKMYMARFARTGATLVASGVPLLQILEIVAKAINNVHIEHSLNKAAEKVKGGKALSETLEHDPNFLVLVPSMLKIGEQSGAIQVMLEKTADYYEKEVDNQIKAISTLIEPLMMVVLGVVALTIVAAILLPIYGLVGKKGFGG